MMNEVDDLIRILLVVSEADYLYARNKVSIGMGVPACFPVWQRYEMNEIEGVKRKRRSEAGIWWMQRSQTEADV